MTEIQKACFICQKHKGEIVVPGGAIYEDSLVYAGHVFPVDSPVADIYLGHLIVEPKRHVPGLAELTDEEARQLGWLITRLSQILKQGQNAEHIYLFVLGHQVDHLHVHLVPRYPGTPHEYWGMRLDEWPDAPLGGVAEINALCDRLRTYRADYGR